jgi:hypothetical protein
MKPIYLDIHIHTSENPAELTANYDSDKLLQKVKEISGNDDFLVSLTDHNTVNKSAYLNLLTKTQNVLLGCELHIKYVDSKPPYHCHIIFGVSEITVTVINDINIILDELYPEKVITPENMNVPTIERVIDAFMNFDFVLLPHGGQSHKTFDMAVPSDRRFDSTIERSIYYNQFDGFTARDNSGLNETQEYFARLGIKEFVNLVTCTDNYNPSVYPEPKSPDAGPFIPTWLLSEATFEGLRLALSESERFIYSHEKPIIEYEHIEKVVLLNDKVDIDVKLMKGLNVVIGGSSSGKTLFVDSVNRKIKGDFENSKYISLEIENISISNPSGIVPHYISQNYITSLINNDNDELGIANIDIIKNVFPEDLSVRNQVRQELDKLKNDINLLINSVEKIEEYEEKIKRIPIIGRLLVESEVESNLIKLLLPSDDLKMLLNIDNEYFQTEIDNLHALKDFMRNNPFAEDIDAEVESIVKKIEKVKSSIDFENSIREVIERYKIEVDTNLISENSVHQTKISEFEKLSQYIKEYVKETKIYYTVLGKISNYGFRVDSKIVESMGHKLQIENTFFLSKDKFLESVNRFIKTEYKISNFDSISPDKLYKARFKAQQPKIQGYEDFKNKVYSMFENLDKRKYKIVTNEGHDFDNLSAGWKSSVLLDLILGYTEDNAPIIIDQPEDNLATDYINKGLINSIKKIKKRKQIILVSHNATIPMLGDAQNIILCENLNGLIKIRNAVLEGKLNSESMVDHVARITDGGKPSIKKRVKKYNLKKFRGE